MNHLRHAATLFLALSALGVSATDVRDVQIESIEIVSHPGLGGSYSDGDEIIFYTIWNSPVSVYADTTLVFRVGPGIVDREAVCAEATLVRAHECTYVVQSHDEDDDGISIRPGPVFRGSIYQGDSVYPVVSCAYGYPYDRDDCEYAGMEDDPEHTVRGSSAGGPPQAHDPLPATAFLGVDTRGQELRGSGEQCAVFSLVRPGWVEIVLDELSDDHDLRLYRVGSELVVDESDMPGSSDDVLSGVELPAGLWAACAEPANSRVKGDWRLTVRAIGGQRAR